MKKPRKGAFKPVMVNGNAYEQIYMDRKQPGRKRDRIERKEKGGG